MMHLRARLSIPLSVSLLFLFASGCGGGGGDENVVQLDSGGMSVDTGGQDTGVVDTGPPEDTGPPPGTADAAPLSDGGCLNNLSPCNGVCVDLQSSQHNCGKCGNSCGSGGAFCDQGKCTCIQSGFEMCNGKCLDVQNDNQNCGKCGKVCGGGEACQKGKCEILSEVEQIIKWTNDWRSKGVTCKDGSGYKPATDPVKGNKELHRSAQYHAENMAKAGFFAHDQCDDPPSFSCKQCSDKSKCYGPGWRVKNKSNYSGSAAVGENIAMGQKTPRSAVKAWITSKTGHCKNLMSARWNRIGVGVARGRNGRMYWVQVFGRMK